MLDHPEPRALPAVATPELELVRNRADDRDPKPALAQLLGIASSLLRHEAAPGIRNLDHDAVGVQLVEDVDHAAVVGLVGVPHGVRAGLGQRQLEVGDDLVGERAERRATASASRHRVMYSAFAGICSRIFGLHLHL